MRNEIHQERNPPGNDEMPEMQEILILLIV